MRAGLVATRASSHMILVNLDAVHGRRKPSSAIFRTDCYHTCEQGLAGVHEHLLGAETPKSASIRQVSNRHHGIFASNPAEILALKASTAQFHPWHRTAAAGRTRAKLVHFMLSRYAVHCRVRRVVHRRRPALLRVALALRGYAKQRGRFLWAHRVNHCTGEVKQPAIFGDFRRFWLWRLRRSSARDRSFPAVQDMDMVGEAVQQSPWSGVPSRISPSTTHRGRQVGGRACSQDSSPAS